MRRLCNAEIEARRCHSACTCQCAEVLAYTPKYTASEAAGTPLPIRVKTLGKLSYKMHVQPVLGAKSLDVIFVQV